MKLREFLQISGLQDSELAERLQCAVSELELWLAEDKRPDWAMIDQIARVTGGLVTANDFMNHRHTGGMAHAQDAFDPFQPSLLFDTRAHTLLEVFRRKKADDWSQRYRKDVAAWNAWSETQSPVSQDLPPTKRFDVHRIGGRIEMLVVNVQGDQLRESHRRVVVPLLPAAHAPSPLGAMHPTIQLSGAHYLFVSNHMFNALLGSLGPSIGSVADDREILLTAMKALLIELLP